MASPRERPSLRLLRRQLLCGSLRSSWNEVAIECCVRGSAQERHDDSSLPQVLPIEMSNRDWFTPRESFGAPEPCGDKRGVIMNQHDTRLGISASSIARGRPKRQIVRPAEDFK